MSQLRLEPLTEAHLADFEQIMDDPEVLRYTMVPDPPVPGYSAVWYARYQAARQAGTQRAFAAVASDGAFLGIAMALRIDDEAREMELGCMVAPAARSRGVATEILRQLTSWAFTEGRAMRVTLIINVTNVASQRVAARGGYTLEGVLRSTYFKQGARSNVQIWSRLPTDGPVDG